MRDYIEASEGMILTDGSIYGKKIFLAEGVDRTAFYEITEEEYKTLMAEETRDDLGTLR